MDTTTVGGVAAMAGITVRTLHHYDEIGLLVPSERRSNGYRAYTGADIDRLQRILTYRELDLSLDEIASILDEPRTTVDALTEAGPRVTQHIDKLHRIMASLEAAIESEAKGIIMTPQQKLEAFGDFDPDEYTHEANQNWGSTPQFAESMRRTSSYTPGDWQRMHAEQEAIYEKFVALIDRGSSPESPAAKALVQNHRDHISAWFYDCTPAIHAGLGAVYVSDIRFKDNIDKARDGLAEYLSAAIAAAYGVDS
jgi:DNA-binding transcriptional MerR regulator